MTTLTQSSGVVAGLLALPAGFAFGLAYFQLVRRSVQPLAVGERRFLSLASVGGRLGAAALVFFFAARLGAWSLLALFAGFLIARKIALRPERRPS